MTERRKTRRHQYQATALNGLSFEVYSFHFYSFWEVIKLNLFCAGLHPSALHRRRSTLRQPATTRRKVLARLRRLHREEVRLPTRGHWGHHSIRPALPPDFVQGYRHCILHYCRCLVLLPASSYKLRGLAKPDRKS